MHPVSPTRYHRQYLFTHLFLYSLPPHPRATLHLPAVSMSNTDYERTYGQDHGQRRRSRSPPRTRQTSPMNRPFRLDDFSSATSHHINITSRRDIVYRRHLDSPSPTLQPHMTSNSGAFTGANEYHQRNEHNINTVGFVPNTNNTLATTTTTPSAKTSTTISEVTTIMTEAKNTDVASCTQEQNSLTEMNEETGLVVKEAETSDAAPNTGGTTTSQDDTHATSPAQKTKAELEEIANRCLMHMLITLWMCSYQSKNGTPISPKAVAEDMLNGTMARTLLKNIRDKMNYCMRTALKMPASI
jgi:thiol:disulfide interchange protein